MTGRIFISYRRGDSAATFRLCDHLKEVFGPDNVFMDNDMPVGKFKEHLHSQLNECGVLLAIIGPNWDDRRLFNPDDWVRVEIAAALARRIKVVPVIIDDAVLPKPSDLPSDLKSLPEWQAFRMQNTQFERDFGALKDKLRETVGQTNATDGRIDKVFKLLRTLITELMERRGFQVKIVIGLILLILAAIVINNREVLKQSISEEIAKSNLLPSENPLRSGKEVQKFIEKAWQNAKIRPPRLLPP